LTVRRRCRDFVLKTGVLVSSYSNKGKVTSASRRNRQCAERKVELSLFALDLTAMKGAMPEGNIVYDSDTIACRIQSPHTTAFHQDFVVDINSVGR